MEGDKQIWDNDCESVIVISVDCLVGDQRVELYDLFLELSKKVCKQFINLLAQKSGKSLISLVGLGNQPHHMIQIGRLDLFEWYQKLEGLKMEIWNHLKARHWSLEGLLKALISAHGQMNGKGEWTLIIITSDIIPLNSVAKLSSLIGRLDEMNVRIEIQVVEISGLTRYIGPEMMGEICLEDGMDEKYLSFLKLSVYCRNSYRGVGVKRYSSRIEEGMMLYMKKVISRIFGGKGVRISFVVESIWIECLILYSYFPLPYLGKDRRFDSHKMGKKASLNSSIEIGDAISIQNAQQFSRKYFDGDLKIEAVHRMSCKSISESVIIGSPLILKPIEKSGKGLELFKSICHWLREKEELLVMVSKGRLEDMMNEKEGQSKLFHYYIVGASEESSIHLYVKELTNSEQIMEEPISLDEEYEKVGNKVESQVREILETIPECSFDPWTASSGYHEYVSELMKFSLVRNSQIKNQLTNVIYKVVSSQSDGNKRSYSKRLELG